MAELTALPEPFLAELDGALWAKQQAILVGPPGTSKTYLARQFARYFVRQRPGYPQGSFEVLYMHANWTYEDFFEGLKPTSKDGTLMFEPRLGFFLKWVEGLHDYPIEARHVLVLDAKYKREFADESRTDRFQMCAYAVAFDANRVTLVYPTGTAGGAGGARRELLRTNVGGKTLLIDSLALPMAAGPDPCRAALANAAEQIV